MLSVMAKPPRGIYVDVNTIVVGGAVALIGVAVLVVFIWMVPSAAAREAKAACQGLHSAVPKPAACPGGQPCNLPVPAKDFEAIDYTGKHVHLSDYRGKVVILDFWASWCITCKFEKPSLYHMAKELAGDDLAVIALASDSDWSTVLFALIDALVPSYAWPAGVKDDLQAALKGYGEALPDGLPFTVLLDKPDEPGGAGPITHGWGITQFPESALIDRNGMIRAYYDNKRDWESSVAQTCIRSLIDEE